MKDKTQRFQEEEIDMKEYLANCYESPSPGDDYDNNDTEPGSNEQVTNETEKQDKGIENNPDQREKKDMKNNISKEDAANKDD